MATFQEIMKNRFRDFRIANDAITQSRYVAKETGKGLSTNDYTTAEKNKLSGVQAGAQANVVENIKVDGTLQNVADKTVNISLSGKVDKVTGKGLSTNDFTTAEKNKLASIAENAQVNVIETVKVSGIAQSVTNKAVNIDLSGKVDKITGKQLSTNDYTTAEKNKLANIEATAQVNAIETVKVNGTALPISNKAVDVNIPAAGDSNIIEVVKVNGTALKVTDKAVNIDLSGKVDKVTGKALSTNDYTTAEKNKLANIEATAQVNAIESIKVNGTALPISNKAVDINLADAGDSNVIETIKVNGKTLPVSNKTVDIAINASVAGIGKYFTDVFKPYDDTYRFAIANGAPEETFDVIGQANVIEIIKVNGEPREIDGNDKSVNIDVPEIPFSRIKVNGVVQPVEYGAVNIEVPIKTVKVNGTALPITDKAVNIDLSNYSSDGQANVIETVKVNNTALKVTDKAVNVDLSNYVQKDGSKVLSTNDYTTAEKNKLSAIAAGAQVNVVESIKVNNSALTVSNKAVNIDLSGYASSSALDNKVDKVTGKALSTNDYTTAEKNKLSDIAANAQVNTIETVKVNNTALKVTDKAVNVDLSNYVQKDGSKVLSTNDYTTTEKNKLSAIAAGAQVNVVESIKVNNSALTVSNKAVNIDLSGYATSSALNNKVDKVSGKALSTNDYTTAEKNKLANIAANAQVNTIETVKVNNTALKVTDKAVNVDLTNYVQKDGSKVLSTNDYTTTEKNKLSAIAAGAQVNVVESIKVNNSALTVSNKAVNIDLSGYATSSALDNKVDKVSGKALSTNDYTTAEKNKLANIAANAQVNTIETVKVNGTALKVTDKTVNIDLSAVTPVIGTNPSTVPGAMWLVLG